MALLFIIYPNPSRYFEVFNSYKDLPNGWLLRLSTNQILDLNQQQIEDGIEPDVYVELTEEDIEKGVDTILEYALSLF